MALTVQVLVLLLCGTLSLASNQDVSGLKFIGVGYNLLKANPDGGSDRQAGVDPGLLLLRKVFQLDSGPHPRQVLFTDRYSCLQIKSTHVFYGTKSYQEKLGSAVDSSGKGNVKLVNFQFSLSAGYGHAKVEGNEQRKVFFDDVNICNRGRIRFAEELADSDGYTVTRNFASAVCKLPSQYDTKSYMQFLDEWGTHVTMEVEIGNRTIKRYQASLAQFIQHVQRHGGFAFKIGGSYLGSGGSLGVDFRKYKQSDKYEMKFGQYEYSLRSGRIDNPEPIHIKVKTLVMALDPIYWRTPEVLTACPAGKALLGVKSNNLLKALEGYVAFKMAPSSTDPPLTMPITWPLGTYGLVKSKSGCPAGRVKWSEGSRHQDTEDSFNKNAWSNPIHISGLFTHHKDMTINYCMKGNGRYSNYDVDWPAGDYCILKYGNCPSNFKSGYVFWDDEDIRNHNSVHGSLPDGHYDRNTMIDFCCRDDSLPTKEILLPTEIPFYLLKYTRECQHVHGMSIREEIVRWDDQDVFNGDKTGGAHPYDDGGRHNHRLHFCYYYRNAKLIG